MPEHTERPSPDELHRIRFAESKSGLPKPCCCASRPYGAHGEDLINRRMRQKAREKRVFLGRWCTTERTEHTEKIKSTGECGCALTYPFRFIIHPTGRGWTADNIS